VFVTRWAAIVRHARPLSVLAVAGLLFAACGGAPTTPDPGGVALVTDAAVTATIGADGGELMAADPERGRSYRVSFPAGAFLEDTLVTATPIASIDGFPLDGVLLGGLELSPDGADVLVPVTLVISLDAARQADLTSALDDGQAVAGFSYPTGTADAVDDLALGLADVADDRSSVTVTLTGFSGHGAGTGSPQNLANRPCPQEPARNAACRIHRILHPPGGPADPTDPAVRTQVKQVLRDWLDVLEVVIDTSSADPAAFAAAVQEASAWWITALVSLDGLVSELWSAPGDELFAEGARLDSALYAGWQKSFSRANDHCRATVRSGPEGGQDLDGILALLDIHERARSSGLEPPPLQAIAALGAGAFCARLTLTAESSNPTALSEGTRGEFRFRLRDASGGVWLDTQLDTLQAAVTATPADPGLMTASGDRLSFLAYADVTAVRAVPGNSSEGRFEVTVSLFGSTVDYASATAMFDITGSAPASTALPPITCSGSPVSVATGNDSAWAMIRYDGGSACELVANLTDDDDPNAILALDLDPGDAGWDAHDGRNWTREGSGIDNGSGTYHIRVRHDQSGRWFVVSLTVEVMSSGGSGGTMTVRDVSIAPEP